MKIHQIFCIIVCLTFYSCLDSDFATNDLIVENDINYLHPSLDLEQFPNDHYRIVAVTPEDDFFNVIVEYGGGCEEHRFYTWWDGNWKYSDPAQATIYLAHGSRGDECERVVRDTVQLDLQKVFNNTYPQDEQVKISVKNAYRGRAIEVDPYLADIVQSKNCELDVTLSNMECFNGIWQHQGFVLADSVPYHGDVWIQPVRSSQDIGLDAPGSGNYKVGLTLLFGFEYDSVGYNCDNVSESITVPAVINCLELK